MTMGGSSIKGQGGGGKTSFAKTEWAVDMDRQEAQKVFDMFDGERPGRDRLAGQCTARATKGQRMDGMNIRADGRVDVGSSWVVSGDGTGSIDKAELKNLMDQLCIPLTDKELEVRRRAGRQGLPRCSAEASSGVELDLNWFVCSCAACLSVCCLPVCLPIGLSVYLSVRLPGGATWHPGPDGGAGPGQEQLHRLRRVLRVSVTPCHGSHLRGLGLHVPVRLSTNGAPYTWSYAYSWYQSTARQQKDKRLIKSAGLQVNKFLRSVLYTQASLSQPSHQPSNAACAVESNPVCLVMTGVTWPLRSVAVGLVTPRLQGHPRPDAGDGGQAHPGCPPRARGQGLRQARLPGLTPTALRLHRVWRGGLRHSQELQSRNQCGGPPCTSPVFPPAMRTLRFSGRVSRFRPLPAAPLCMAGSRRA